MDIGGYTIDNKYLAAGAAGLGILFLVNRNKSAAPSNIATLQPANGLTWADVLGQPSSGLVGGTGESGPPGAPGPAGPPGGGGDGGGGGGGGGTTPCVKNGGVCTKDSDCCARHTCVAGICTAPTSGGGGGGSGGGGTGGTGNCTATGGKCKRDHDCCGDDICFAKVCTKTKNNNSGGQNNPTNPRNHTSGGGGPQGNQRPAMPSIRNNPVRRDTMTPPDVRSPREQAQRNQGNNRVFRENINGSHVTVIDRGGRAIDRGRDANAQASGGSFTHGDFNGPSRVRVNVSGGHAYANSAGGNGNQTGAAARRTIRSAFGRGGEVASNDSTYNGYGRQDGAGNQSSDYVNTHPSAGGGIGGFSPMPVPMQPRGATTTVQAGETLRGVATRVYGYDHFVPRLYTLNQDILMGRTTLQAGTVLKI